VSPGGSGVGVELGDEDVGRRGWKADGVSQGGRGCMGTDGSGKGGCEVGGQGATMCAMTRAMTWATGGIAAGTVVCGSIAVAEGGGCVPEVSGAVAASGAPEPLAVPVGDVVSM
jgi:hypothetical protein